MSLSVDRETQVSKNGCTYIGGERGGGESLFVCTIESGRCPSFAMLLLRYYRNTLPGFQGSSLISPVQARGDTAGKAATSAKPSRMLCSSRSPAGNASRAGGGSNACGVPGEDSIALGDVPSSPPRPTSSGRVAEGKDVLGRSEYVASEVGETSRRKTDVVGGGEIVAVSTGAPGITVSDWSLQSCDDADDGAVRFTFLEHLRKDKIGRSFIY